MKQVVRTFLRNKEGKFLLVQHPNSDHWTLPGGHIEKGESLYKALKREIQEEFHLEIKILGDTKDFEVEHIKNLPLPLAIYRIEYESRNGGLKKKTEYIFLSEVKKIETLRVLHKEIANYKWCSISEILEMENVYKQVRKIAEKLI